MFYFSIVYLLYMLYMVDALVKFFFDFASKTANSDVITTFRCAVIWFSLVCSMALMLFSR